MDEEVAEGDYQLLVTEPPTPPAGPGRRPPTTAARQFTHNLLRAEIKKMVDDVIRDVTLPFLGDDDLPVSDASEWQWIIDWSNSAICASTFITIVSIISIVLLVCAVTAPQPAGQAIPSGHHYFLPADAAPPFNRSVLVAVDDQFATTIMHPWLLACASLLAFGSLGLLATGAVELFEQCRTRCSLRRHTFATELGPVACQHEVWRIAAELNSRSSGLYGRFWRNARPALLWAAFWSLGVLICIIPLLNWSAGGRASSYRDEHYEKLGTVHSGPSAPPDPSSVCPAAALQFGHVVGGCLPQSQLLRRNINEHWRPPKWTCPSHRAFLLVPDSAWNSFNFSQPDRDWCVSPCRLDAQGEVWSTLHYQNATYRWPCVAAVPQLECVSIWLCSLWGIFFAVISFIGACIAIN